VRTAPSDDIQGPAAASYAYRDLGARDVLVIDDTADGRAAADSFQSAFTALAGTSVVRRALNPGTTDFSDVLAPLADQHIDSVYFGGFPRADSGGIALKRAMLSMGFGDTPFQTWDAFFDGSGRDAVSFIAQAGTAAANSYASRASMGPMNAEFVERYRAAYGSAPDEYSAAAYACTQIIVDALRGIAPQPPSPAGLREAVRAYVVDPTHRYQTIFGSVGFDANGDSIQQFVTFYRADLGANGGRGDWIAVKQQDFGPAP
jgi:branched-chain amino acid transport system substrate-binding protein